MDTREAQGLPPDDDAGGVLLGAEQIEVGRRRYREARAAGFSFVEASLFADSDQDIGTLRKLVESGCPVELMRRILL